MTPDYSDIAVVTDSTADLPATLLAQYDISAVPAILVIDGHMLEDGPGISRRQFYQRLPAMQTQPTTSAPSAGSFMKVYEAITRRGIGRIISIHAASQLSGIFNAAQVAAQAFGDRVKVVDSGQVTLGLGFQVLAACEAIARGEAFEKVLAYIEDIQRRVRVIAMLDSLEYVRRSGRVSWARASLGTLLNIKPFIELKHGVVLRLGEARTRHKGIVRLLAMLNELGPLERLGVLHTNAEADAQAFLAELTSRLNEQPLLVNVTTIIGTHVGPNGLGFCALVK